MNNERQMERIEQAAYEVANARAMQEQRMVGPEFVKRCEDAYKRACDELVSEFEFEMGEVTA
jgi:hypothetical protein